MQLFVVLTLLIIHCVSGWVACDAPYECSGQSINTNISLHSGGYKSSSGGSTDITTTGGSHCSGAFSCSDIKYLKTLYQGLYFWCTGGFSCSNITTTDISTDTYCEGSNSCHGTKFNGPLPDYPTHNLRGVLCRGDRSCAHSEIRSTSYIRASGSYSLYKATIYSVDSLVVSLYAHNAGFGARIFCQHDHYCTISCYGTGCNMMYIDCDGDCDEHLDLKLNSVDTVPPIFDYNLFDESTLEILFDSYLVGMTNDEQCSFTADNYLMDFGVTEINSTNVCCRGGQSCRYITTIQSTTTVECSGQLGCWNVENISSNDAVYCSGSGACCDSDSPVAINAPNVYCTGYGSCCESTMSSVQTVYCSGSGSCSGSTISMNGSIHFGGKESGMNASITCQNDYVCDAICSGYDTCLGIHVYGEWVIQCDRDSGCPDGISYAPTTSQPTASPTPSTSGAPTQQRTSYGVIVLTFFFVFWDSSSV